MDKESPLAKPIPFRASHDTDAFDCGVSALNRFLKKHALQNQQNQAARTYVVARDTRVVGFYSLAAGSARREETPSRVAKGLAAHPVPVILLARLAVDVTEKGHGLGKALLQDALLRSTQVSDIIGCRAVMVQAKDDAAKSFYERFGFLASPTDPMRLFLLMKDVKASLAKAAI